ncbi:MAG: peptidase [Candidatus Puniceispirillales bacterium]|jgi:putative proteasome-type protease|tara:strand:- start:1373 stop:2116 length:744 start_codon:yes stop_codon:yes gene_type:complete
MTYCVGLRLENGLVFMSDTLTNAGVDNINRNKKMYSWSIKNYRSIILLTSGNLATSQAAVNIINEKISENDLEHDNILKAPSMFKVARIIGRILREVTSEFAADGQNADNQYSSTFILGGQIKGDDHKLFLIYPEGNFIESSEDQPFFQIGETKYGKPIIVRAYDNSLDFGEAIKLLLVSFDSTMKANVSVGLPIDLCTLKKSSFIISNKIRIDQNNLYFKNISERWGASLKEAIKSLPTFKEEINT